MSISYVGDAEKRDHVPTAMRANMSARGSVSRSTAPLGKVRSRTTDSSAIQKVGRVTVSGHLGDDMPTLKTIDSALRRIE